MEPIMTPEQALYVERTIQRITRQHPTASDRALKTLILDEIAADPERGDAAEIVLVLRRRWGFGWVGARMRTRGTHARRTA